MACVVERRGPAGVSRVNLKARDHQEDLSSDERITEEWIFTI